MTAIGLATAVPAVLGYNFLVRRNKTAMPRRCATSQSATCTPSCSPAMRVGQPSAVAPPAMSGPMTTTAGVTRVA